jgi:hypothetical protein
VTGSSEEYSESAYHGHVCRAYSFTGDITAPEPAPCARAADSALVASESVEHGMGFVPMNSGFAGEKNGLFSVIYGEHWAA